MHRKHRLDILLHALICIYVVVMDTILFLSRSLFDLVNSSYCLDLDDKRLLTWYCNLSNEERDIIRGN